jgi:hypothetical protein
MVDIYCKSKTAAKLELAVAVPRRGDRSGIFPWWVWAFPSVILSIA